MCNFDENSFECRCSTSKTQTNATTQSVTRALHLLFISFLHWTHIQKVFKGHSVLPYISKFSFCNLQRCFMLITLIIFSPLWTFQDSLRGLKIDKLVSNCTIMKQFYFCQKDKDKTDLNSTSIAFRYSKDVYSMT